jgi:hypothetical protein
MPVSAMSHTNSGPVFRRPRRIEIAVCALIVAALVVTLIVILRSRSASDGSKQAPFGAKVTGIGYGTPAAGIAAAAGCADPSVAPSASGSGVINLLPNVPGPTSEVLCSINGVAVSIASYASEQAQVSHAAAAASIAAAFGGSIYASGDGWSASLQDRTRWSP